MSETKPAVLSSFEKGLSKKLGLDKNLAKLIAGWEKIEIKGLTDKVGYMAARTARTEIKKKLTAVDTRRKDIKRDYVHAIDSTAAAISEHINPHLLRIDQIIHEHDEGNRQAAEAAVKAANARIEHRLLKAGAVGWNLDFESARSWSEEKFEAELVKAQEDYMVLMDAQAQQAEARVVEAPIISVPAVAKHGDLPGGDIESLVKYAERLSKAEGPKDLVSDEARMIWNEAKLIIDQAVKHIHDSIVR